MFPCSWAQLDREAPLSDARPTRKAGQSNQCVDLRHRFSVSMSKEILISQPPPSNFGGGAATSGGFASAPMAPPPISNYKGVMLCDRPVSKEHAGVHGLYGVSDSQRPFLSMVQQKEQLGLCPSKESRLHEGAGTVAAQRGARVRCICACVGVWVCASVRARARVNRTLASDFLRVHRGQSRDA